jgi:hypothetical protein
MAKDLIASGATAMSVTGFDTFGKLVSASAADELGI